MSNRVCWCVLLSCLGGALSIDESVSLCQAVCSGNACSVTFFLLPQPLSSVNLTTVFKHRRLIEDKAVATLGSVLFCFLWIEMSCAHPMPQSSFMFFPSAGGSYSTCMRSWKSMTWFHFVQFTFFKLRTFDVHEVALAYNMSSHQGDKRKTSQQCGLASYFVQEQHPVSTLNFRTCNLQIWHKPLPEACLPVWVATVWTSSTSRRPLWAA